MKLPFKVVAGGKHDGVSRADIEIFIQSKMWSEFEIHLQIPAKKYIFTHN